MTGKSRTTLHVRIPAYRPPRNEWRRAIHAEVVKAVRVRGVTFSERDRIELLIVLYLPEDEIGWHDVDNRLKDIMDALQGRAGGMKAGRRLRAIVPNDNQIHKVTIEKLCPPPQSLGCGHLRIRTHR